LSDWTKYNWFWHGVEDDYPLCCIFFFMNVWTDGVDDDVKLNWTSNKDGYIPCTDCLVRLMEKDHGRIC